MRILFAGTPAIAVPSLRLIATEQQVCAVLTGRDAPAGRGAHLLPSAVKQAAVELGLPVLEPVGLDAPFRELVRELRPELLVVVAYGRIFREEFLALFPRGAVNLHPSLLPRHRGPTPIPATILAGDREGGVTVQRVAAAVDSGNILAQERVPLDGTESTSTLTERLAPLGARLLAAVLREIAAGSQRETEQEHSAATFCHKLAKRDGQIDWGEEASLIARKVRAYDPYPGTFTGYAGRSLAVLAATGLGEWESPPGSGPSVVPGPRATPSVARSGSGPSVVPGVVLGTDKRYGVVVSTGKGCLGVQRLQLAARRALDWRSFLNGVPGFVGSRLGVSDHAATVDTSANRE